MINSASKNLLQDIPLLTRPGAAVFFWRGSQPVTAAEFLGDVASCAALLPDGEFVCNLCEDQYWFTVAFCAAIVRGLCNLLPANHRQLTVAGVAEQYADCPLLVDKQHSHAGFSRIINVPEVCVNSTPVSAVPMVPQQQLAARVFTSGSTGESVAIDKSWLNLVKGAELNNAVLPGLGADSDFTVSTVSPWHMYGLEWSVLAPLQANTVVFCGNALLPANVQAALADGPEPRRLISTPVHLNALARSALQFPVVDVIMSATAPLSAALAAAVEQKFAGKVLEIYGCSEAGSMASRSPLHNPFWRFHAAFAVDITAEHVELSAGHLQDKVPLPDRLAFEQDGSFTILGRSDDLVKVGGKRESMLRLNRLLNEIECVEDGVFFLRPAEADNDACRLAAFVVSSASCLDEVRSKLSAQIDPVFMPRPLLRVTALPREASGKLPRANLLQLLSQLEKDTAGE